MTEVLMKANILVAALVLFFLGCTSQQSEKLTQQQKEQIKGEAKVALDSIFAKWGRLDVEGALQYYSPELLVVGDSSLINYEASKKGWMDFASSAATAKWTAVRWEFIVLTKDLVISAWMGKVELLLKSGDKITVDPQGYTDVCKRVGGQWKVIYEHPSGTAVTQKADKK
jgi:hypothetical protein